MNPLNSCAFNILMQLLLKTLIMHFYFLAIPAPPPPFLFQDLKKYFDSCNGDLDPEIVKVRKPVSWELVEAGVGLCIQ